MSNTKQCVYQRSDLGFLRTDTDYNDWSKNKQCSLRHLTANKWQEHKRVSLDLGLFSSIHSIAMIKKQLYCCCQYDGIYIYNRDLEFVRKIDTGDMGHVYQVTELGTESGDLVTAAEKGLFLLTTKGVLKKQIAEGDHTSVAVYKQDIYAARCDYTALHESTSIVICKSEDGWKSHLYVTLPCSSVHEISLTIVESHLFVCCWHDHTVLSYVLDDKVLKTRKQKHNGEKEELFHPRLCQGDNNGVVLLSDSWNNRLQILHNNNNLSLVETEQRITVPRFAFYSRHRLYVATYDKKLILFTPKPRYL